jgi:hypothetical protein
MPHHKRPHPEAGSGKTAGNNTNYPVTTKRRLKMEKAARTFEKAMNVMRDVRNYCREGQMTCLYKNSCRIYY